mmetsp:Transcript_7771/g.13200  ORF Transcript_7771/g.13200 Transcript_7771/m.13200 type:complete len:324 (+) Transcript_7771:212-1183(+)
MGLRDAAPALLCVRRRHAAGTVTAAALAATSTATFAALAAVAAVAATATAALAATITAAGTNASDATAITATAAVAVAVAVIPRSPADTSSLSSCATSSFTIASHHPTSLKPSPLRPISYQLALLQSAPFLRPPLLPASICFSTPNLAPHAPHFSAPPYATSDDAAACRAIVCFTAGLATAYPSAASAIARQQDSTPSFSTTICATQLLKDAARPDAAVAISFLADHGGYKSSYNFEGQTSFCSLHRDDRCPSGSVFRYGFSLLALAEASSSSRGSCRAGEESLRLAAEPSKMGQKHPLHVLFALSRSSIGSMQPGALCSYHG